MGQKRRTNTHNLGIQKYRIESCQIQKCKTFSLTAFLYIFLRIRHTEIVMLKWRSFMKRKFGMATLNTENPVSIAITYSLSDKAYDFEL